ncbi:hypothetical protein KCU65_g2678, partial [Aureobasidium melanogenum]
MAFSISFSAVQFFEGKLIGSTFEDTTSVSEDEVLPSEGMSWDLVPCEDEPRTAVAAPVTEFNGTRTRVRPASSKAQQQQQQPQQSAQPGSNNPPPPASQEASSQQPTGSNNPFASSFNRPQQTQQQTLSAPQEQKTATQFNQPAYNPIPSYQAPQPAAAPSLGPMSKTWELLPRKKPGRKRKRE